MAEADIVQRAIREAEEEARRLIQEASRKYIEAVESLVRDTNPLVVASRIVYAVGDAVEKSRPPPPDKLVGEFLEQALPKPDELAEALPRMLPNLGEAVRSVIKAVDPVERVRLAADVALPIAIIVASILVSLTIVIALVLLR